MAHNSITSVLPLEVIFHAAIAQALFILVLHQMCQQIQTSELILRFLLDRKHLSHSFFTAGIYFLWNFLV